MKSDKSSIFAAARFQEKNMIAISSLLIAIAFLKIVWSTAYTDQS